MFPNHQTTQQSGCLECFANVSTCVNVFYQLLLNMENLLIIRKIITVHLYMLSLQKASTVQNENLLFYKIFAEVLNLFFNS